MKANNITIENALHLAFTPEYIDTFGLVEIAEVWNSNHDTRDLDLNLNAYAEKCTYKMEQDGLTLEFDAWDRLTAEIERLAGVWVLLYCNEVSWNNRPEWLANSVRNAINTPETSDTMNTETNTAICPLDFDTVHDAYNYAMAHRLDKNPLAVAIPTDAHGTDYGRSLALNGVKLFGVWSDALDSTANGYVYTTEAGAIEAMKQVEEDDKEAGIYEPGYYTVLDMTKYFI